MITNFFTTPDLLGLTLIRQEFSGVMNLVENNLAINGSSLPEANNYSGFIVYEENGNLVDWAVNVNKPDLSLSTESEINHNNAFPHPSVEPNLGFQLTSPSNWELEIDFGLAFDAPRYTLTKENGTKLTLESEVGLTGSYVYTDDTATIIQTTANLAANGISVPESNVVFGLIFAFTMGVFILKKRCLN